jgi:hypothetical protein
MTRNVFQEIPLPTFWLFSLDPIVNAQAVACKPCFLEYDINEALATVLAPMLPLLAPSLPFAQPVLLLAIVL